MPLQVSEKYRESLVPEQMAARKGLEPERSLIDDSSIIDQLVRLDLEALLSTKLYSSILFILPRVHKWNRGFKRSVYISQLSLGKPPHEILEQQTVIVDADRRQTSSLSDTVKHVLAIVVKGGRCGKKNAEVQNCCVIQAQQSLPD
jgi:hypothetical protein